MTGHGAVGAVKRAADALLGAATDDHERPAGDAEVVAVFRRSGPEILDAATPQLWAYYRETAEVVGTGEWGVPVIPEGSDIWQHVRLPRPPTVHPGGRPLAPSPWYLSFEGEVTWEPEHGLQLVFDHTGTLVLVGPFEGSI